MDGDKAVLLAQLPHRPSDHLVTHNSSETLPAGGASRFHQGALLSASSPPSAPPELYSAHSSRRRAPPATHHRHTRSRHNVGSAETRPGHFAQSQTLPLMDLWSSVETEVGCRCGSGTLTPGREE
ncbi:unnamed protein product [Boreogadus saida]